MTREEAIKLLHDMKDTYDEIHENTNYEIGYEQMTALDMAIEALSAEAEWIPCSERLPSESGEYLCTIPLDAEETYVRVLTFYKGRFYEDDDEWGATYHDDVIAWMPLPKPYREDGE